MSYKLKIDKAALNDIQQSIEWYELQLSGLGIRFKTKAKKQINSFEVNPQLFSINIMKSIVVRLINFRF